MGCQHGEALSDASGMDGAHLHATHTTDTEGWVGGLGMVWRDGSGGALGSTCSAALTAVIGFGHGAWTVLAVRTVTRQSELGDGLRLGGAGKDGGTKLTKLRGVARIGASGGKLPAHAVLGDGCHGCHHPETRCGGYVLHLYEGVVVGAVAIDGDYHAPGAMGADAFQPLYSQHRHASGKDGHGDDDQVVGSNVGISDVVLPRAEFGGGVRDADARTQQLAHASRAASGTECDLMYSHR